MREMKKLVVGVPLEMMSNEGRIPLLPSTVVKLRSYLAEQGISLGFIVQSGLGGTIGFEDGDWSQNGIIMLQREKLFEWSDIILQVKQPTAKDVEFYREGQGSLCFHHTAANRAVVDELLKKGICIMPREYHRPSLSAMSKEAGRRVVDVLTSCYPRADEWLRENIFIAGARGVVGQHAINSLISAGVDERKIYKCDVRQEIFISPETGREYWTFSSEDRFNFHPSLENCKILILAAASKSGAPKIIKREHLKLLQNGTFILQVAIDEGGNIDVPDFSKVTYWSNPVYPVRVGGKGFFVCNISNLPGCIRPGDSSVALDEASYGYYCEILSAWPNVPEKYLFKRF